MNKKIVIISSVVIILLLIFFLSLKKSSKTETGNFILAKVTKGDIENIVSSTGTLSAVETVEVGSQVSGIIRKIYVDYNDKVKKGELLAVLDKTLYESAVENSEAGLMKAKARMDQAKAELERDRPLFKKGHLSETEFLLTKTTYETTKADYKIALAALNKTRTNLNYTDIHSPIDGIVIERTVDEGQTIAASFQAPKLFVIAKDLKNMQIEADVDESDIGQIRKGQNVRFTVQSYPEKIFKGMVRQIRLQPQTIQNVVNYTVVINANNDEGTLLPGMTATVDFLIEERKGVLIIPNAAINFKPTMEMMKKYGDTLFKGKNRTGKNNVTGNFSKTKDKHRGRVYCLDQKGAPFITFFAKGATDGKNTEILKSRSITEGTKVIIGYERAGKSKKSKSSSGFRLFGPPRGGK
jgi:HlyD family secretion protein